MKDSQKTKTYSTNKIFFPILFIFFSIILEIANFLYFGFENASGARMVIPTYFLIDLAIMFMIAGLIFVSHHKVAIQVLFHFFLAIQVVMYIINTTLYGIFGDVLSFDLLKLGAEATTAFTLDLVDWGGLFLNLAIEAIIIFTSVMLAKRNKTTWTIKNFSTPILLTALFIFVQSFGLCLFEAQTFNLKVASAQQTEIEGSDKYLWENFQFKLDAYKKFGFFGFYVKGTTNLLFPMKVDQENEYKYINYIDEGYVEGNPEAPLYNQNLIVVLCESLDTYAIDPIMTPTLWKLQNGYNSINMDNFYARNRTNNSEGITMIGSMPKNLSIREAYSNGYKFSYSLPKLFEMSGDSTVSTAFFHNNEKTFYERNITHGELGIGFDSLHCMEAYTGDEVYGGFGNWRTDLDFIANQIDYILPKDTRFLSYFTSLSNHGPWIKEKSNFKEFYKEYDEKFEEHKNWFIENNTEFIWPGNSDTLNLYRNYKVGAMDLDKSIKLLIDEINLRGLSDNTSILLYADHNAYYHDLTYKMKGIEKTDISNVRVNNIPLILYSPSLLKSQGYQENQDGYIQGYSISFLLQHT